MARETMVLSLTVVLDGELTAEQQRRAEESAETAIRGVLEGPGFLPEGVEVANHGFDVSWRS